jgi:uncharacterized short protein YbdD (DUF466 family)
MAQYQEAQNTFGGALSRLMANVEAYPELRSQENFGRFMTQIEGQENRIRVAIRDYNEAVRQYKHDHPHLPRYDRCQHHPRSRTDGALCGSDRRRRGCTDAEHARG